MHIERNILIFVFLISKISFPYLIAKSYHLLSIDGILVIEICDSDAVLIEILYLMVLLLDELLRYLLDLIKCGTKNSCL